MDERHIGEKETENLIWLHVQKAYGFLHSRYTNGTFQSGFIMLQHQRIGLIYWVWFDTLYWTKIMYTKRVNLSMNGKTNLWELV